MDQLHDDTFDATPPADREDATSDASLIGPDSEMRCEVCIGWERPCRICRDKQRKRDGEGKSALEKITQDSFYASIDSRASWLSQNLIKVTIPVASSRQSTSEVPSTQAPARGTPEPSHQCPLFVKQQPRARLVHTHAGCQGYRSGDCDILWERCEEMKSCLVEEFENGRYHSRRHEHYQRWSHCESTRYVARPVRVTETCWEDWETPILGPVLFQPPTARRVRNNLTRRHSFLNLRYLTHEGLGRTVYVLPYMRNTGHALGIWLQCHELTMFDVLDEWLEDTYRLIRAEGLLAVCLGTWRLTTHFDMAGVD